jgi:hypothetical protein
MAARSEVARLERASPPSVQHGEKSLRIGDVVFRHVQCEVLWQKRRAVAGNSIAFSQNNSSSRCKRQARSAIPSSNVSQNSVVSPACIESRFRRPAGHPSHDLADTVWVDLESDDTYVIDEDEVGPGPVPGVSM